MLRLSYIALCLFLCGNLAWSERIDIDTIEELQRIGNDPAYPVDGVYFLVDDIDASATADWNGGEGFRPIQSFSGSFDGQGYRITDFFSAGTSPSLFTVVETSGVVRNLVMEDMALREGTYGWAVEFEPSFYSGLVARNRGLLKNCSVSVSVVFDGLNFSYLDRNIGGLVGENYGLVSHSSAHVAIWCDAPDEMGYYYIGGLIGVNYSIVEDCFALGQIVHVRHYPDYGTLPSYYNIGGLIGKNGLWFAGEDGVYHNVDIFNSFSAVDLQITYPDNAGGFLGMNGEPWCCVSYDSFHMAGCYWDVEIADVSRAIWWPGSFSNQEEPTSRTTAQMMSAATFEGWNFDEVWDIVEGETYPFLRGVPVLEAPTFPEPDPTPTPWPTPTARPIEIDSIEELQFIGRDPAFPLDGDYVLTQDIDASATWNWNGGFRPIAPDTDHPFVGTLDGQGHCIVNLFLSFRGEESPIHTLQGLFGVIATSGTVRNQALSDLTLWTQEWSGGATVGGICGWNMGLITECSVSGRFGGEIVDVVKVGGVAGRNDGTITRCGTIVSITFGGIGQQGGLVGVNPGGKIQDCWAKADFSPLETHGVQNDLYIGGLAGTNGIVEGLMTGPGTILNCYAASKIPESTMFLAPWMGGVVAVSSSGDNGAPPWVRGCYWDWNVAGTVSYDYYEPDTFEVTSKTTTQMMSEDTFEGWDFDEVWDIVEGETYPFLRGVPVPEAPTYAPSPTPDPSPSVDPIEIDTIEKLQRIGNDAGFPADGIYRLAGDIDASATAEWNDGWGFEPIRNFSGRFYGKRHSITGLYCQGSRLGLFSEIEESGVVQDLVIKDLTLRESSQGWGSDPEFRSGLAAVNRGYIYRCAVSVSLTALEDGKRHGIGGLVGENFGFVVRSAAHVAFLSQARYNGSMHDIGGVAGWNFGFVQECYSLGQIVHIPADLNFEVNGGYYHVGGLIGKNGLEFLSVPPYTTTEVRTIDCFSAVRLDTHFPDTAGGVIGLNGEDWVDVSYENHFMTPCYWDRDVAGVSRGIEWNQIPEMEELVTSRSTAQMMSAATFEGWNFDEVWNIVEGETYPFLRGVPVPEAPTFPVIATPTPSPTPVPTPTPTPLPPEENDQDGDGYSDAYELEMGTDPESAASAPDLGDINDDGIANNLDAVMIMNYSLGNLETLARPENGDVNRDGSISNLDAIQLFNWTLGNLPILPLPSS